MQCFAEVADDVSTNSHHAFQLVSITWFVMRSIVSGSSKSESNQFEFTKFMDVSYYMSGDITVAICMHFNACQVAAWRMKLSKRINETKLSVMRLTNAKHESIE